MWLIHVYKKTWTNLSINSGNHSSEWLYTFVHSTQYKYVHKRESYNQLKNKERKEIQRIEKLFADINGCEGHHVIDAFLFMSCLINILTTERSFIVNEVQGNEQKRTLDIGGDSANRRSPFRSSLAPEVSAKVEFTTRKGFCRGHTGRKFGYKTF